VSDATEQPPAHAGHLLAEADRIDADGLGAARIDAGSAEAGGVDAGGVDAGRPAPGIPPSIDATRLRVAIARLSRRLRRHELAGLTPTQLSALATVEQQGPLRLGDVAAAEGIAPSTLTRIVTALEECAYVKRSAVPGDARASTLAITPRGHEVLERIRHESTAMLAESLTMLRPEQIDALARALPALEQLAEVDPRENRAH